MAPPDQPPTPPSPDRSDRQAYLQEQIERQKRGEPIDTEWVRKELERVRLEQAERMATSQRNLRWVVLSASALLLILWVKNGGANSPGGLVMLGLIAIGLVMALGIGRKKRP